MALSAPDLKTRVVGLPSRLPPTLHAEGALPQPCYADAGPWHALRIDAQAPAMRGNLLDVEDGQTRALEDPVDRGEREVGVVLVVDGVELVARDQVHDVRKLECCDPGALQEN